MVVNRYSMSMLVRCRLLIIGENPYQIERDANGNPITYLDDGTVSQDPTVGTTVILRLALKNKKILGSG